MLIDKEDKGMIKVFLDSHYPLTVISDRYGGVYSQGKFLAFPVEYHLIPQGPLSSDRLCGEFWKNENSLDYFIGKGDTPNEAIDNLHNKYYDYLDYL